MDAGLKQLREVLFPHGEADYRPVMVACAGCGMTLWATSDNALVESEGEQRIFCRTCAEPPPRSA